MYLTSAIAIYVIFWFFCLFLVLPFHARRDSDDAEPHVAGQADSAPATFPAGRVAMQTTAVAALLFAAYYINYANGWVTLQDVNLFQPPKSEGQR